MALKLIRQMTFTIGGVSKDDLAKRLNDGGNEVSNLARDIMLKPVFTTLPEPVEIELGWITVRGLGFTKDPTTRELFARIKEVAELCPAEVGPHLRLTDSDQQRGTWYGVASEPIPYSDGDPGVFEVKRRGDGSRWLSAFCASPGGRWFLGITLVVRLCK